MKRTLNLLKRKMKKLRNSIKMIPHGQVKDSSLNLEYNLKRQFKNSK